jgi:hypothetical protein
MHKASKKSNTNPPHKQGEDSLNRKNGEKPKVQQLSPGKQMDLEELIKIVEEEEKNKHLNL